MKMNSNNRIPLWLIVFAIFSFSFLVIDQNPNNIFLEIQNVSLSKDKPATFLGFFQKDETITINYSLSNNSKQAVLADITTKLIDLKSGEIRSFRSGQNITVNNTGNFKIEFSSTKQVALNINAFKSIDNEGIGKLEVLKLNKCFIDEKKNGKPNFKQTIQLKANDQLSISSSDPKSSMLVCYIPRTGETYLVKDKPLIDILDDGNYSIEFYIDRGSVSWLKQAKEGIGLDGKDFYFSDINVSRIRQSANTAQTKSAEVAKKEAFNPAVMLESSNKQFKEIMEKGELDAEARNKMMADLIGILAKKDTLVNTLLGPPTAFNEEVPAKLNYVKTNKVVKELEIDESAAFWMFWIGTGDGAELAFKDKNQKTMNERTKPIFKIFSEKIIKAQNISISTFPMQQEYPEGLYEDIEFAIVDELNKDRFLRGEPYSPFTELTCGKSITTSFGFAKVPESKNQLYLCMANNNKVSPVQVNFQLQTFQLEQDYR